MNIEITKKHSITSHLSDVNCVSFSKKYLATGSGDKTVRVWNLDSFTECAFSPLTDHTYYVNQCAFSITGHILASCSTDGKTILWDSDTGEKLATLMHPGRAGIRSVVFSLNSQFLATGSEDGSVCMWSLDSRELIRTYLGHEGSVLGLAFTPDSRLLVSGATSCDLRIWSTVIHKDRYVAMTLDGHDMGVLGATISPLLDFKPDGVVYLLATCGGDDNVKLWTITTFNKSQQIILKLLKTLKGHKSLVMSCCFSPTGSVLVSSSGDHTIRLWNPSTMEPIYVFEAHSRYVTCCAFCCDETLMATGSNDKSVHVWNVQIRDNKCGKEESQKELACASNNTPHLDLLYMSSAAAHLWAVDQVVTYLSRELGLGQYAVAFYRHAIDGSAFLRLTEEQMQQDLKIDVIGHRNKILNAINQFKQFEKHDQQDSNANSNPQFYCPITHELMRDPVIASDGHSYERSAIETWFQRGGLVSPLTNQILVDDKLVPNHALRQMIDSRK